MTCLLRPALTSVRFGSTLAFIPSPSRSGRPRQRPGSRPSSPPCGSAARARWRSRRSAAMRASCAMALIEAGVKVFLVNPRRIKAVRDAEGLIAKTDKLDASLIARFAHAMAQELAMAHELRPLRDVEHEILKALSTRRRQLTESIAIEKTRLKQVFDPLILESCREMIAILEGKRRTIEAELDRRIAAEDRMARRRAILASIPAIATPISTLVVVEMPELGLIDRKAAASLAGLAPHPSQSGLARAHNAISGGRPCVRSAFSMAALVAVRTHPRFKPIDLDLTRCRKTRKSRPRRHSPTHRHPRQRPPPRRHNLQKCKLRSTSPIQSPGERRTPLRLLDCHVAIARQETGVVRRPTAPRDDESA